MGVDIGKNRNSRHYKSTSILDGVSDEDMHAAYRCVRTATGIGVIYGVSYNTANRRLANMGITLKWNRFRKRERNVQKVLSYVKDGLSVKRAVQLCLEEDAARRQAGASNPSNHRIAAPTRLPGGPATDSV